MPLWTMIIWVSCSGEQCNNPHIPTVAFNTSSSPKVYDNYFWPTSVDLMQCSLVPRPPQTFTFQLLNPKLQFKKLGGPGDEANAVRATKKKQVGGRSMEVNRPLQHKLLTINNYVNCPSNFSFACSIRLFHPPVFEKILMR